MPLFELTAAPLDPARLLAAVSHPSCGAALLFVGTTRERNEGRQVLHLEYEAYDEMCAPAFEGIAAEVRRRHGDDVRVAIAHRKGRVEIGEASVVIATAAPRRDACYRASRDAIELLKRDAPIWKRESFAGGDVWVEGPGAPPR